MPLGLHTLSPCDVVLASQGLFMSACKFFGVRLPDRRRFASLASLRAPAWREGRKSDRLSPRQPAPGSRLAEAHVAEGRPRRRMKRGGTRGRGKTGKIGQNLEFK